MWIVRLALRRPYTFIVMALLIAIGGVLTIARTPVRANQRAAELARNLYAQGLTDFLTVLVAEESVFTSQDDLAQTGRDVALQLVALYKAVGGGWEMAADGPQEDTHAAQHG